MQGLREREPLRLLGQRSPSPPAAVRVGETEVQVQRGSCGSRASIAQALLAPDAHSLTLSHLHKVSNSLMRRLKLREAKSLPEVMQSEPQLRLDPPPPPALREAGSIEARGVAEGVRGKVEGVVSG